MELPVVALLADLESAVRLELPRACDYVLEFSMTPTFLLAAGVFGSGSCWTCPPETWEWYFRARYFARALDRRTRELLGAWTFDKTTPGRDEPLAVDPGARAARPAEARA